MSERGVRPSDCRRFVCRAYVVELLPPDKPLILCAEPECPRMIRTQGGEHQPREVRDA